MGQQEFNIPGYLVSHSKIAGFTVTELNGPLGRFYICDCGEELCRHIRQAKSFSHRLRQRLAKVISNIF